MSAVFSCGNCKKDYNDSSRRPLSLPCGHVFCEECICFFAVSHDDKDESSVKCPSDNKLHQLSIKTIPICHQIMANLPDSCVNKNALSCLRHPQRKIKFICNNHQTFLCSVCVNDHAGSGHELEPIEVTTERMATEFKNLIEMYENEAMEAKEINEKYEKIEKCVNEYFNHQYNKVEITFEKLVHLLQEKRKKIIEELNHSKIDCRAHFKREKEKILKKSEGLTELRQEISNKLEELVEKKKYEEFFVKKQVLLSEFKAISSVKLTFTEIPFAYFSNSIKLDDTGCIKYFKSFKEIEQRYSEKRRDHKQIGNQKEDQNILGNIGREKQKSSNVFQDNLLNNKNYSTSPQKQGESSTKNLLKVEKQYSSNSANTNNQLKQSYEKTNSLINEFDVYKEDKFSEMERKPSIKKEDFKKIVSDTQEALKASEISKPHGILAKEGRKASFPFSHREHPVLANNHNGNIHNNNGPQYFQHDKNFQLSKQGSNSKNENFFSNNKMNRNNVILNTNITTSVVNNPVKPGQKRSDEKVILSPTNIQLNTNSSSAFNAQNLVYQSNNYVTNTLPSEKGDSNPSSKAKRKQIKADKFGSQINSINKVLVTQSENSIDHENEGLRDEKRSISNKIESKPTLNSKKDQKEAINRSSSNNKLNQLKPEDKKKLVKKTTNPKIKKKKQQVYIH